MNPQIDKDGYLLIPVPPGTGTRRYTRMMLEHRFVAEKMLGRKLRADEVVHHRNCKKLDNPPANLEVMTRSAHAILHLKVHALQCSCCGGSFSAKSARAKYCSSRCKYRSQYLRRDNQQYFRSYREKNKLAENRTCKTCSNPLGLAHRNRDYCSASCDPWH